MRMSCELLPAPCPDLPSLEWRSARALLTSKPGDMAVLKDDIAEPSRRQALDASTMSAEAGVLSMLPGACLA